jgi:hypothetical protein
MRRPLLLALISIAFCSTIRAQIPAQTVEIPQSACVVRSGDSPAWSSPGLDDSTWIPLPQWTIAPTDTHAWIRCHTSFAYSAVLAQVRSANEVYYQGQRIGGNGSLAGGHFSMNIARVYVLPAPQSNGQSVLAIRLTLRVAHPSFLPLFSLILGTSDALKNTRDHILLDNIRSHWIITLGYYSISVLGLVLLVIYAFDRTRPEIFLLGLICVFEVPMLRSLAFFEHAFFDYPSWLDRLFASIGNGMLAATIFFNFTLAGRTRVPLAYKLLAVPVILYNAAQVLLELFPAALSMRLSPIIGVPLTPAPAFIALLIFSAAASTSGYAAFWPLTRIPPRLRAIAFFSILWGTADAVWFALDIADLLRILPFNPAAPLYSNLLAIRAFTTAGAIAALIVLILRDQSRVAAERATLAGEMLAAREVQQRLVPVKLPGIPGLTIEAAYMPAAEVGGDFYQVLAQPGGSAIIVIGDVSGKGLKAAMTATLALGTLRTLAEDNLSPAQILSRLNTQLAASSDGGFVTCLVVRIAPNGMLTVANAGHIAPYLAGEELHVENGLPLGLSASAVYEESSFRFGPGQQLTLMTDGVVEARSASGELFGFERTALISTQSADEIAAAAQALGQEDDITVLTLTPQSPEAAHA